MNGTTGSPAARRRWWWPLGTLVILAAVVVTVVAITRGGEREADASGAPATTSASPTSTAEPLPSSVPEATAPPGETAEESQAPVGEQLPPSQAAVRLDRTAEGASGVQAALTAVDAIQGQGVGPGAINGPALRISVRLTNGSGEPLSLGGVQVTMTHGEEHVPASPLNDDSQAEFRGDLPPGESADGRYVFTVPADRRDLITVTVGYQAGAPFLVFSGPVS